MKSTKRITWDLKNARVFISSVPLFFTIVILGCTGCRFNDPAHVRKQDFDLNWKFRKGDHPNAYNPGFDDTGWDKIDLPHDWAISGEFKKDNPSGAPGGFAEGGIGWYRKEFVLPKSQHESKFSILFDGVYMNSEVWINGHYLGKRPYGYIPFEYDLTSHLKFGDKNVIAVRVDDAKQPSARWYTGAGIYRHVWLRQTSKLHLIDSTLVFVTPKVSRDQATIEVEVKIQNDQRGPKRVKLVNELFDADGKLVAEKEEHFKIKVGKNFANSQNLTVKEPALWSPESPDLYVLQTSILEDGEVKDQLRTQVGIRSIRFDIDSGFFLNGKNVKIKGVNNHSDLGALGAALNDRVLERRLEILKEMGCNAIRTAHNPPSSELLDLCDKMGFMVMDEVFDEWKESWPWEKVKQQGKAKYGYHLYFDEWAERDLADLIRRDRNHPSVILWSVGNEIPDQCYPEGTVRLKKLMEVAKREDPTRPVTCGITHMHLANATGFAETLDVTGYNGGGGSCFMYEQDRETYPNRKFIATEVPHTFQTRGVYRSKSWYRDADPLGGIMKIPDLTENEVFDDTNKFYSSSYDNATVRISARDSWRRTRDLPYMSGEFRWTGFDYLGESLMGWPAKFWNYGIIDMCGFPKDTYYFYQSQWTEKPMVHILPHWSWPGKEGVEIPVTVYSNCESVELLLNGKSLGEKKVKGKLDLVWKVPYVPGELKAVGKIKGVAKSTKTNKTAGKAAKISLLADREQIRPGGKDVVHIEAQVVDENDVLVPGAANLITFSVKGDAQILGIDNGDPLNNRSYKGNEVNAFKGKCLLIVKPGMSSKNIEITASSEGLAGEVVVIGKAKKTD